MAQRRYNGRRPSSPLFTILEINSIRKRTEQDKIIYVIYHGGSYTSWNVATFELEQDTLTLVDSFRAIS